MSDVRASVVVQNVLNVYASPEIAPDLSSQLVFGQHVLVLDVAGEFARVQSEDGYVGWVLDRWLASCIVPPSSTHQVASLFADVYDSPSLRSRIVSRLPLGCHVSVAESQPRKGMTRVSWPGCADRYIRSGHLCPDGCVADALGVSVDRTDPARSAAELALCLAGTPYLWGGTTPFGIDCSGLAQLCIGLCGVTVPRDAKDQYSFRSLGQVATEGDLSNAGLQSGDLVFFGSRDEFGADKVTHVGLVLDKCSFVHSAGKGRGVTVTSRSDPEFACIFLGARRVPSTVPLALP